MEQYKEKGQATSELQAPSNNTHLKNKTSNKRKQIYKKRYLDFSAIDNTAQTYGEAVIRRYLPHGKVIGVEFACLNPIRADNKIGSFKFNLTSGYWADFACGIKGKGIISYLSYATGRKPYDIALELVKILGMEVYHD